MNEVSLDSDSRYAVKFLDDLIQLGFTEDRREALKLARSAVLEMCSTRQRACTTEAEHGLPYNHAPRRKSPIQQTFSSCEAPRDLGRRRVLECDPPGELDD